LAIKHSLLKSKIKNNLIRKFEAYFQYTTKISLLPQNQWTHLATTNRSAHIVRTDGLKGNPMTDHDGDIIGMYDLLEALEAVIKAADPAKRAKLAEVIDAYSEHFPEEFFWAVGAQSPALLHNLIMMVDASCRSEAQSRPRGAIRLVGRKPEGDA
jgi:hypothetical protein